MKYSRDQDIKDMECCSIVENENGIWDKYTRTHRHNGMQLILCRAYSLETDHTIRSSSIIHRMLQKIFISRLSISPRNKSKTYVLQLDACVKYCDTTVNWTTHANNYPQNLYAAVSSAVAISFSWLAKFCRERKREWDPNEIHISYLKLWYRHL